MPWRRAAAPQKRKSTRVQREQWPLQRRDLPLPRCSAAPFWFHNDIGNPHTATAHVLITSILCGCSAAPFRLQSIAPCTLPRLQVSVSLATLCCGPPARPSSSLLVFKLCIRVKQFYLKSTGSQDNRRNPIKIMTASSEANPASPESNRAKLWIVLLIHTSKAPLCIRHAIPVCTRVDRNRPVP